MFSEIWESIKSAITLIYDRILYRLVKPMYFVFTVFLFYCFMTNLVHGDILLAFASLYAAIIFFNLFEEEK